MRHHILVKWNEQAQPDAAFYAEIEALFAPARQIPGISAITLHRNVIDRPNRYDLLILLCMDKDALPRFDASEVHLRWKEAYAPLIASKAIFDCE